MSETEPAAGSAQAIKEVIPGLDGLRGLAILLVVVHNVGSFDEPADTLGLKFVRLGIGAGWIGVQLFFVLSGFLITRILLETKGREHYFRSFYVKRFLRIFPLYYVTLAVAFLILPRLVDLGSWTDDAVRSQVWYWTYLINWAGPVAGVSGVAGFPHFWSLAVEEQFYLIWPVVVLALSTRRLVHLCWALIASALLARIGLIAVTASEFTIYSLTVTRWDALAAGALVAVALADADWHARVVRWIERGAVWSVCALAVVAVTDHGLPWFEPLSQILGYLALAGVAAFVVWRISDRTLAANRLRWAAEARWLRFFGKYSYGMYVLHWPIHWLGQRWAGAWVVAGTGTSRITHLLIYVAASLVVTTLAAIAVWYVIERPFLALKATLAPPDQSSAASLIPTRC